jgi:hypothetical protein
VKDIGQQVKSPLQLVINPAHLPAPFELIRGEPKAREHDHQNEAIPELQPPLDGLGDHFGKTFNIQHSTPNIQ